MLRQELKITPNGTFPLDSQLDGKVTGSLIVYLSGNFGGGTCTLVYKDLYDTDIPLIDGVLSTNSQYQIDAGISGRVYLKVAGSTSPAISLIVTGKA